MNSNKIYFAQKSFLLVNRASKGVSHCLFNFYYMNQNQHEYNWFSIYFHVFIWSLSKFSLGNKLIGAEYLFLFLSIKLYLLKSLQWFKLIFQFYLSLSASCTECFELYLYHSVIHLPTLIVWTFSQCKAQHLFLKAEVKYSFSVGAPPRLPFPSAV